MLPASPRSSVENLRFTAKRAEMDYCRVVGPCGLCRPLDDRKGSQQTLRLSHLARVARKQSKAARLFEKRLWPFAKTAGAGQAGIVPSDRPWQPPRPPRTDQSDANGQWSWVCGHSLLPNVKNSIAGLVHYSPRIPGGFTLPHRSDGTLGPGPRSEPRAPMKMVSGALGSLEFRV